MRSVLFPGLDSLVGLARHGIDVKPTLLRVLTDLYVQKDTHTDGEERQFVELALRLIDAVDADTRAVVARRLSGYANAPKEVLSRLAGAAPVPATDDHAADYTAAERSEPPSATPAATQSEVAAADLTSRFFAADTDGRLRILATLDAQGPLDLAAAAVPPDEKIRALEASALAGRPAEFIRELERALGVTRTLAEAIVNDRSGEPLVVAARALAIPLAALQRILLFVNPAIGQSVRRVYALTAVFEGISVAAALRLVTAWRQAAPAERRAPRLSPEVRPARNASTAARVAVNPPTRGSANLVTRNREFGAPSSAPQSPSANNPVKKMTT